MPLRPFQNIDYSADIPGDVAFRKEEIWSKISTDRNSPYKIWVKIAMTLLLILSAGGLFNENKERSDSMVPSLMVERHIAEVVKEKGYNTEKKPLLNESLGDSSTDKINSANHSPNRSIVILSAPNLVIDSVSSDLITPTHLGSQVESHLVEIPVTAEATKIVNPKKELSASAIALKGVFDQVNANNLKENYAIEKSTLKRLIIRTENAPPMARVNINEENAFNYIIYEKNTKD
ncbi:MAG TPA: hypothetical protein VK921_05515 [Anditalea sp.]|nr:hypothetical protein [Anditalea sp.]